jgi:hypothetical protein
MTAATPNSRPTRKQLADQLDRLDGIIDALADGLQQAVADAAREGTRLDVKDAIVEILTNPELRALLASQVPPPPPAPTTPRVSCNTLSAAKGAAPPLRISTSRHRPRRDRTRCAPAPQPSRCLRRHRAHPTRS